MDASGYSYLELALRAENVSLRVAMDYVQGPCTTPRATTTSFAQVNTAADNPDESVSTRIQLRELADATQLQQLRAIRLDFDWHSSSAIVRLEYVRLVGECLTVLQL